MIRIHQLLKEENYRSKMIMQVHDELVFNMVSEEREELITKIQDTMENVLQDAPIPLIVDVGQ